MKKNNSVKQEAINIWPGCDFMFAMEDNGATILMPIHSKTMFFSDKWDTISAIIKYLSLLENEVSQR